MSALIISTTTNRDISNNLLPKYYRRVHLSLGKDSEFQTIRNLRFPLVSTWAFTGGRGGGVIDSVFEIRWEIHTGT